jgi:xylulokinase
VNKSYLIGVDLGTSGTKAALYTVDGVLVAEASQEVPLYYPRPGVVEQENDDFYTSAAHTVRSCLQQSGIDPRQVAAVAFDSQMAGVGSVDEDFHPATRFDSWLDMRCQPYIEHINRHFGERVTELTGCAPTCDHGPKMLWWKEEHPQEYARIAKFIMPTAYVAGRMAEIRAEQAFIDYTFIHFSGLSDARQGTWSPELCNLMGIQPDKLPQIVEPWRVIGEVKAQAARDFSLAPGTILAAGCGDTAACALGAGIVKPGMLFDTAGTASVLAGSTDQFITDSAHRALLTMRSVVPGLWHPLAYIAGGGLALRWFRDQFFNTCRGNPQPVDEDLYERMVAAAAQISPGAEGLYFSPHLGGRICPSTPEMRGAWTGFSWTHTQAHFFRAVLESVAFEYAYYLKILREMLPGFQFVEARVAGGGAKSPPWNQIKANVLGVPYFRLKRAELGTWGSAMIAGKAAGLYSDLAETAYLHAGVEEQFLAVEAQTHALYAPLVEHYIKMEAALAQLFASAGALDGGG